MIVAAAVLSGVAFGAALLFNAFDAIEMCCTTGCIHLGLHLLDDSKGPIFCDTYIKPTISSLLKCKPKFFYMSNHATSAVSLLGQSLRTYIIFGGMYCMYRINF